MSRPSPVLLLCPDTKWSVGNCIYLAMSNPMIISSWSQIFVSGLSRTAWSLWTRTMHKYSQFFMASILWITRALCLSMKCNILVFSITFSCCSIFTMKCSGPSRCRLKAWLDGWQISLNDSNPCSASFVLKSPISSSVGNILTINSSWWDGISVAAPLCSNWSTSFKLLSSFKPRLINCVCI